MSWLRDDPASPEAHASSPHRPARRSRSLARALASACGVIAGVGLALGAASEESDSSPSSRAVASAVATTAAVSTIAVTSGTPAKPALAGLAVDAWGRVLDGVRIVVAPKLEPGLNGPVRRTQSDAEGRFVLENLPPGAYRLVATKAGYGALIGEVDTFVDATIDVVLYPLAARTGAPQTPADGSWALRLPKRDGLESREPGVAAPESARASTSASSAFSARTPVTIAIGHTRGDQGYDDAGDGFSFSVEGGLELPNAGRFEVSLSEAELGIEDSRVERASHLGATWYAPRNGRSGDQRVELRASRESADLFADGGESWFEHELETVGIGAEHRHWDERGELVARLDVALAHARQSVDGLDANAVGDEHAEFFDGEIVRRASVGDSHDVTLIGRARAGRNGVVEGDASRADALLAPRAALSPYSLTALDGHRVDVAAVDRWQATRRWALLSAADLGHAERAGEPDAWRGSAVAGIELALGRRTVARAYGGAASLRSERGPERSAVWGARIQHRADRFELSLARTSELGGRSALIEGLGDAVDTLVVSDESGRLERWHASAEFTAPGYWPSIALRGTHFEMQGRSAIRLPGDLALAHVESDGRLEGLRFDLEFASPRLGTAVSFVWEGVEDSDDLLGTLAGAERWERRAVEIRQRLGWRELWGTRCFLLLGLSDHDVDVPSSSSDGTPEAARLALLERRRVSGGLAVAF